MLVSPSLKGLLPEEERSRRERLKEVLRKFRRGTSVWFNARGHGAIRQEAMLFLVTDLDLGMGRHIMRLGELAAILYGGPEIGGRAMIVRENGRRTYFRGFEPLAYSGQIGHGFRRKSATCYDPNRPLVTRVRGRG
jgi:hypothetical protein